MDPGALSIAATSWVRSEFFRRPPPVTIRARRAPGRDESGSCLSAILMMVRVGRAVRIALGAEDFVRVLGAAAALILTGTLTFWLAQDWSLVDSLYVAVATLTTSSILDPELTITDAWLKLFTAGYVLLGIGILVEVARRLGMAFIAARAKVAAEKQAEART